MDHEWTVSGAAAKVTANLQALGARAYFLSVVGNDMAGSLLQETLRERGLDDQWLITAPSEDMTEQLQH